MSDAMVCDLCSLSYVSCGWLVAFFCQAEDGIRDLVRSRGLGDVYKRQRFCQRLLACNDVVDAIFQRAGNDELVHLHVAELALSLIHI